MSGEHDEEAESSTQKRQTPVIVSVTRTPVRSSQDGMHGTDEVDKGVTHQKEEVNDGGNSIHSTEQDTQFSDDGGDDKTVEGLIGLGNFSKRS